MMDARTNSLTALKSLSDPADITTLQSLGVYSVAQLADWPPARDAELILGLSNGAEEEAFADGVALYIDEDKQETALEAKDLAATQHYDLNAVDDALGDAISDGLGLETIGDLATYAPFLEARQLVRTCDFPPYCVRPSAPDWLLPEPVGATETKIRLSNYVRDMPFEFPKVPVTVLKSVDEPYPSLPASMLFTRSGFKGWMGYLALFRQRWVNAGNHLGEVVHSLALAPGESRNISVVDWFARQQSARDEDSEATETLTATFHQKRAINEVVEATAVEHLYGQTDIDATTKTTGYGLTAGYGGGSAVNNTVGGAAELDLMQLVQLPIDVSAQGATSNTNTHAGGVGGSYVSSKGTLQGTVKSETGGSREVLGEVTQNISDSTAQNAANVRSLFSTVIVEDVQSGQQKGQTRNVTNYNHSHALTVQYFEILQKYIVTTRPESLKPVVFLPFKPVNFTIQAVIEAWPIVSPLLKARVPNQFDEWDYAIRNYVDENTAFDPDGEIKITSVRVDRTRSFTAPCQVELDNANPVVKFSVTGGRVDDCLKLRLKGGSTYVDYQVVSTSSHTQNGFTGGGIDTDESLTWDFSTDFKSDLKREVKELIDSAKNVVSTTGLDFNEISSVTSNRDNLKDMVNVGDYRLMNGSSGIDLSLDITYTLVDQNNNSQTVTQSEDVFFSWTSLHNGNATATFDANAAIESYLSGVADINPSRTIDAILKWFSFHRYGVTKYMLTRMEDEQIVDAIEHLGLGPVPLSRFIDPHPLAMVDNYLIFALRDMRVGEPEMPQAQARRVTLGLDDTVASAPGIPARAVQALGSPSSQHRFSFRATMARVDGKGRTRIITGRGTADTDSKGEITLELDGERTGAQRIASRLELKIAPSSGEPRTRYTGSFRANPQADRAVPIDGDATRPDHKNFLSVWTKLPTPRQGMVDHRMDLQFLDVAPKDDGPATDGPVPQKLPEQPKPDVPEEETAVRHPLIRYLDGLDAYLALSRANPAVEVLHLPTPGVFGEAVLGRSNASEFIDPYRFHNWQDSPIPNAAPGIDNIDLNIERIREIADAVGPEVPLTVNLTPQAPTNWAMPTGLTEAMTTLRTPDLFRDMSKADVLGSSLTELAKVAQAIAEKAGDLSGAAMEDALGQATALGNKTADIAGALAGEMKAPPPRTPTERVTTMNELQRQSENPAPPPTQDPAPIDVAKAETMGADLGGSGSGDGAGGTPSPGGPEGNDSGPLSEGACRYDDDAEIADSFTTPFVLDELGVDAAAEPDGEPPHSLWNLAFYGLRNFAVGHSDMPEEKWSADMIAGLRDLVRRGSTSGITYAPVEHVYYARGLRVQGYTDCAGDAAGNATLRAARADVVAGLLRAAIEASQAEGGDDFARLNTSDIIVDAGAAPAGDYLVDNDTRLGRSRNRAVYIEEFWYRLDISQVPPHLLAEPVSIEKKIEIGGALLREREDEIREGIATIEGEPDYMRNSANCVLDKVLRDDTQLRYYRASNVKTYIDNNVWQNYQIEPQDWTGAPHARDELFANAYDNPDPEVLAKKIVRIYRDLKFGVQEVNEQSGLSVVGDADTVRLVDWIKIETDAPKSIYNCHLGEVTPSLEWWFW